MGSDEEEPEATGFLDIGGFPVTSVLEGLEPVDDADDVVSPSNTRERVPDDVNSPKTKIYPQGYKAH
jgi:hypothetical protein